jgi:hypothetical protein
MHAFTIKSKGGLNRVLVTPIDVLIPNTNKNISTKAIWDTGATASVISAKIITDLGLIPTGMSQVHTANGIVNQPTFIVDIKLPNNVTVKDVTVTRVDSLSGGCDVLIGMDIINIGDLSITNHNGVTCMSFRIPSSHEIDYVLNPVWKHGQTPLKKVSPSNPYTGVSRNALCPCGSGKKYKHCHDK